MNESITRLRRYLPPLLSEKPEDLLQANDILNRISTDSVVEECLDIAYKYKDKASQALEVLPNTTERDCLLDLLEYVFIDCRY